MNIELIKLESLPNFNPKDFRLEPENWDIRYELYYEPYTVKIFQKAIELAPTIPGMCIAVVHDIRDSNYTFGDLCVTGKSSRFIIFNAEQCSKEEAYVHAYACAKDDPSNRMDVYLKRSDGEVF